MQSVSRGSVSRELLVPAYVRSRQPCKIGQTYFPDSFFTIFRKEMMTPYTSLASSSKGKPVLVTPGGCWATAGEAVGGRSGDRASFTATTTPEVDRSELRGLPKAAARALLEAASAAEAEADIEAQTPGIRPPSAAGLGRRVRCQSW